jgi:flavin-dependent dehydrogenase
MTRKRMDPVDVVIIGAGCGGAAFAWQIKRQAHCRLMEADDP